MAKSDYSKDIFKQVQELMLKCDNLSSEVKTIEKRINKLKEKQLEKYSQRYDEILSEGYEENKKIKSKYLRQDEQRLLNRLKKYKENHLMFLYDFSVPFDNNLAERDIRHFKIKQKTSGHFNSMEGMSIYSNIKSIIGTLKNKEEIFTMRYQIYIKISLLAYS